MTTTTLNTKIGEFVNKIPEVGGLVNTTVLNAKIGEVENKICHIIYLFKKTDSRTSDTEARCFNTSDYNKFTSEIVEKIMKEKGLVYKSSISNLVQNCNSGNKSRIICRAR